MFAHACLALTHAISLLAPTVPYHICAMGKPVLLSIIGSTTKTATKWWRRSSQILNYDTCTFDWVWGSYGLLRQNFTKSKINTFLNLHLYLNRKHYTNILLCPLSQKSFNETIYVLNYVNIIYRLCIKTIQFFFLFTGSAMFTFLLIPLPWLCFICACFN